MQDNQAFSAQRGTLRGLHFQRPPEPQAKLIRVLRGSIFDVAVDLRIGSPTYGHWVGETLTAEGGEQLFVPRGFAHGYCTLEPNTEVAYKVDGFYAPECDAGLAWNDPTIGITWPIAPEEAILSDKDKRLPAFADFVSPFRYQTAQAPACSPAIQDFPMSSCPSTSKRILVTGGAGFIGSAVARHLIADTEHQVLVLDKLTYAGNLDSLAADREPSALQLRPGRHPGCAQDAGGLRLLPPRHRHAPGGREPCRPLHRRTGRVHPDQCGRHLHPAAGGSRPTGRASPVRSKDAFRFHHISTDEVFGSLGAEGYFTETTAYDPRSPYSASKAASDHLVRAWHHTFGLPIVVSNCSNNYGPYHFPEKLIPLVILNALEGKPLPVYGDGSNVRDWLYVEDHARALAPDRRERPGRRELQCGRSQREDQPGGGAGDLRDPGRDCAR